MLLGENILNEVMGELLLEATRRNSLITAMKNRWVCRIMYDDGTPDAAKGWRYVEIFCFGEGNAKEKDENGKEIQVTRQYIRAWERSGDSKTRDGGTKRDPLAKIEGWRMFIVDRIMRIEYLKHIRPFGDRPQYKGNDSQMRTTFYCVPAVGGSTASTSSTTTAPDKPTPTTATPTQTKTQTDSNVPVDTRTTAAPDQNSGGVLDNLKNRIDSIGGDPKVNPAGQPKKKRNIYESDDIIKEIGLLLEAMAADLAVDDDIDEVDQKYYTFVFNVNGIRYKAEIIHNDKYYQAGEYGVEFYDDGASGSGLERTGMDIKHMLTVFETMLKGLKEYSEKNPDVRILRLDAIEDQYDKDNNVSDRFKAYTWFLRKRGYQFETHDNSIFIKVR